VPHGEFLQELADEYGARRWLRRPDTAAESLSEAGVDVYPSVFVGRFQHNMSVDETD
jgi:hypothetical protein